MLKIHAIHSMGSQSKYDQDGKKSGIKLSDYDKEIAKQAQSSTVTSNLTDYVSQTSNNPSPRIIDSSASDHMSILCPYLNFPISLLWQMVPKLLPGELVMSHSLYLYH